MIKLTNLSKTYGNNVKAVDNISLDVNDNEIFGFLGPNGAGKTTTIKMLTGILNPDKGDGSHIIINNIDISKDPIAAKKEIGFVSDDPNVFLKLKGIEYLKFLADIYDVPSDIRKSKIEELAEKFGMSTALGDKIQSYSHGMRQKIVMMGVLIHNPSLWILDEPMTGLDPKSSFTLKKMMREHADSGKTVFFSTHVLEVAEKVCDRVAVIHKGKILFCGKIEEMRSSFEQDDSLEEMFLEITEEEGAIDE